VSRSRDDVANRRLQPARDPLRCAQRRRRQRRISETIIHSQPPVQDTSLTLKVPWLDPLCGWDVFPGPKYIRYPWLRRGPCRLLDHGDLVGVGHGGQPVGDQDRGALGPQALIQRAIPDRPGEWLFTTAGSGFQATWRVGIAQDRGT
jgi:hypothetical protein